MPRPLFFSPSPSPTALPAAIAASYAGLMASRHASAPPQPSSMICPGPHTAPGRITLRLRISHPLMPTAAAMRSSTPSIANCAWLAPKPRNAPHTRLLVRAAIGLHVDRRDVVRPGGVAGGPLEHLHPDRRVGAGVADGAHPDRGEHAGVVAPGPVLEPDRMALGVHPEALLARQRALHRSVEQPGGERRVGLVAHVLLAAERAAVRDQLDGHPVGRRRRGHGRCRRGRPTRPGRPSTRASCARRRRRSARRAWTPARGRRARCAGSGTPRARCGRWRRGRRRRRRGRRRCATARCRRCPRRRARRRPAPPRAGR